MTLLLQPATHYLSIQAGYLIWYDHQLRKLLAKFKSYFQSVSNLEYLPLVSFLVPLLLDRSIFFAFKMSNNNAKKKDYYLFLLSRSLFKKTLKHKPWLSNLKNVKSLFCNKDLIYTT